MRTAVGTMALALWLLPRVAYACSVCFAAKNEANRLAFIVTTGVLTALPLVLIGGLVYWVLRRARALDEATPSEDGPAPREAGIEGGARGSSPAREHGTV